MDPPADKVQGRSIAAGQGIDDALPPNTNSALPVTVSPDAIDDLGPSFKDQANSVALSRQSDDKLAMATAAMTSSATPYNAADSDPFITHGNETDVGPSYKDQANYARAELMAHSNLSPQSTKRSNVSSSLSSSVPMVLGVLVADELLTDEERRFNQETLTPDPGCDEIQPIQQGTKPTQLSSANDGSTPDDSKTVQQMKADMILWVKLILLAIFCNTILVAAVIVGTFCGIGACGSSSANAVTLPPPVMPPSTAPPSDVPSVSPTAILFDSFAPTSVGGFIPVALPVPAPSDGTTSSPTFVGTFSPVVLPPSVGTTSTPATIIGTFPPTTNIGASPPTSRPPSIPTRLPTLMPSSDGPPISVGALVAIAVILDILLVAGCVYGYYKWKRRPLETTKSDAGIGEADVGDTVDPVSF